MSRFSICSLLIALFSLVSCGGMAPAPQFTCTNSNSTCTDAATGITLTISPQTASVSVDTVIPTVFTTTVSNGTNTVVTWQVNNVTGGNQTVGTIDSDGDYLPPATVPSGGSVTITAVSFEDPALSVVATVTILSAPEVTISPTSWTLTAGAQEAFTGTVTGAPTTNINWLVNNVSGGNSTFGQVNGNGVYTAPLSPPPGSTVTVTAASRDYPAASASATVTISGFSTASFQGSYAFSMSGKIASGAFFRAGSFTADGLGNLRGGFEDIRGASCVTPFSFAGTYTVTADGRGTMQFFDGCSPSIFSIVLTNNNQVQISGFDATGTATGQANLQDVSTFQLSGLSGTYTFDFSGQDGGSKPLSQIGAFTADGLGGISNGLLDSDDNGAVVPTPASFSGSYMADPSLPNTLNSNGRGIATIVTPTATLHFSFYIVSRGSAKFVETDTGTQAVAGFASQQVPNPCNPSNSTFGLASVNGNFAFLLAGSTSTGTIATAGSFAADGNGHLTTGVLDENVNGTAAQNVAFSNGTYTVAPCGRGTATFTTTDRTYNLTFYLAPASNAVLQETDSSIVSDGLFLKQQTTPFSAASLQGSYAAESRGLSATSAQTFTGQLKSGGAGAIPSGTLDINTAGTLAPGETITGTYSSVGTNGRATLTLNPSTDNRNFAIYVVNSTSGSTQPQVILVGIDNGRLAAGQLFRQY